MLDPQENTERSREETSPGGTNDLQEVQMILQELV